MDFYFASASIVGYAQILLWFYLAYRTKKTIGVSNLFYGFVLLGSSVLIARLGYPASSYLSYELDLYDQYDVVTLYSVANAVTVLVTFGALFFFWRSIKDFFGSEASHNLALVKGNNMYSSTRKGGVMRYLLASAFLNGSLYRNRVLSFVGSKKKLLAPEAGVNLPLLVRTCSILERREIKYRALYCFLTAITVSIAMSVGSSYRGEEKVVPIILGYILICGVINLVKKQKERAQVKKFFNSKDFSKDVFEQTFIGNQIAEISDSQLIEGDNLIIYDGFNPFVGAGLDMGGWSMSINLAKPKESVDNDASTKKLNVQSMHEKVDKVIREAGFSKLAVKDLLFVNGSDIKNKEWLLPDQYGRPIHSVNQETFDYFYSANDHDVRRYKLIQVSDWQDDLIVSFYIRFSIQKNNLFIEVSRFMLPPVSEKYRVVDKMLVPGLLKKVQTVINDLSLGFLSAVFSSLAFLGFLFNEFYKAIFSQDRRELKQIKSNPLFNYGAKTSIREAFSGESYAHYFQKLDKEMILKTFERIILDGIVDHLDKYNVDTNDLRERKTTIINSGIIVKGGNIQAEALSVGQGSSATTKRKLGMKKSLA